MEKWTVGSHGGTYGGNVIAAAAALATIEAIEEDEMLTNAKIRGEQFMLALKQIQQEYPSIGLGLMIGVEFRDALGQPNKEAAKALQKKAFEQGLILLTCGPWENTIRIIPPLNVSSNEVEEALGIIDSALD